MAWARPPGAPEVPTCPLEALEFREGQYEGLFTKMGIPVTFGVTGLGIPTLYNYCMKRPLYAGIWKHILMTIGMTYIGLKFHNLRREMQDEKDEVLRHYITLHPEDFPPYKRQLIKDTIEPWHPIR